MAGHTPDYGLNYFGPGVPGSITDDGGKFTLEDRLLISRLLKALEGHNHKGGDRLADPTGSPAVTLDTLAGQLSGGLNVYYRVSYVDQYGLETAASPEVYIPTPTPLSAPAFPVLTAEALDPASTAPGLGAGTYTFALTAMSGTGETPLGVPASLTLDGSLPSVQLSLPVPQDTQDNWGVWRRGPGETYFSKIDSLPVASETYVDDGSAPADPQASDPSHMPPTINLTSATNQITVAVPDPGLVSADPSTVAKWRIYRTFTSGSYAASSLLAEIVQTANQDGTGGLATEFVDDGSLPLTTGQPLDISQTLTPSMKIQGGGTGAGALQVRGMDGVTIWAISTDLRGALVTDLSGLASLEGDLFLLAPTTSQAYRVQVDPVEGQLVTTAGTPGVHDMTFSPGDGPFVASPDPTLGYKLTIADDGALVTTRAGAHHPIDTGRVGFGAPGIMGDEVNGIAYYDRADAFQMYVFDGGAWHKQGVQPTVTDAPTNTTAFIVMGGTGTGHPENGTSGYVEWKPPASTGGYPLASFHVVLSPADTAQSTIDVQVTPQGGTATQRAYFDGLADTPYDVSLKAVTVMGESVEGMTGGDYIPGRTPLAPTDLAATAAGSTVTLTWTNPLKTLAGNYATYYAPSGAPDFDVTNPSANGWVAAGGSVPGGPGASATATMSGVPAGAHRIALVLEDSYVSPVIYRTVYTSVTV